MAAIARRATLLAAAAATLPRIAVGQADQRPTLTIAVQKVSNSNTLEPPREQSNVGYRISGLYAEPLIDTDWTGDLSPKPGLATSWRRIDARTVEFDLREGVRFHYGRIMTAEDVAFSFGLAGLGADEFDADLRGACDARPGVGAVSVAQREEGPRAARGLQQRDPAVAVVQVGGRYGREQEAAIRVHQGVALSPDHALGCVVAASPGNAGPARAGRLRIQHRSRGRGAAPGPLAVGHRQGVGHALEGTAAGEAKKPAQGCLPGRKVERQVPPGAVRPEHVEHAVQQGAHRPAARPAAGGRARQERLRDPPFGIGQARCIALRQASKLSPGGRGPHRQPRRTSDTPRTLRTAVAHPHHRSTRLRSEAGSQIFLLCAEFTRTWAGLEGNRREDTDAPPRAQYGPERGVD